MPDREKVVVELEEAGIPEERARGVVAALDGHFVRSRDARAWAWRVAGGYVLLAIGLLAAFGLQRYEAVQRADAFANAGYRACSDANSARRALRQVIIIATAPRSDDPPAARDARRAFRDQALAAINFSDCSVYKNLP